MVNPHITSQGQTTPSVDHRTRFMEYRTRSIDCRPCSKDYRTCSMDPRILSMDDRESSMGQGTRPMAQTQCSRNHRTCSMDSSLPLEEGKNGAGGVEQTLIFFPRDDTIPRDVQAKKFSIPSSRTIFSLGRKNCV